MKRMSKLLALVLTLVMALSLVNTAFAAEGDPTITITGDSNITYSIYRLFDIETAANGGHKYKICSGWENFVTSETYAANYFNVQESGSDKYVLWKKGESVSPADGAALAQLARDYVTASGSTLTHVDTVMAGSPASVPKNGYYLLIPNDKTASGLIAVLEADIEVVEKVLSEGMPTVSKEVMEDSTGKYGKENDAEIGELLYFQTTIIAGAEARNYILHDKMDIHDGIAHMEFVEITGITRGGNIVPGDYYTVITDTDDGCAFHVEFTPDFCKDLHEGAVIVVKYTGKLTTAAAADVAHVNETWLTHIDADTETLHDKTTTKTYDITFTKVDQDGKALAGATFVLKDNVGKYYYWDETNKCVKWETSSENATKFTTTNAENTFTIHGLDAEIFKLVELVVPEGYTGQSEIEINTKEKNKDSNNNVLNTQSKTVTVTNVLGTQLPTTGGMGTTLFYVGGGLLVAAAVVLLALKKRKAE